MMEEIIISVLTLAFVIVALFLYIKGIGAMHREEYRKSALYIAVSYFSCVGINLLLGKIFLVALQTVVYAGLFGLYLALRSIRRER